MEPMWQTIVAGVVSAFSGSLATGVIAKFVHTRRLGHAAKEWRELAEVRESRIKDLSVEVHNLREEVSMLRKKIQELIDFNLALQKARVAP